MDTNDYSTILPTSVVTSQYTYFSEQQLNQNLQQVPICQIQQHQLQQNQQTLELQRQLQKQQTVNYDSQTADAHNLVHYSLGEILQTYYDKPDLLQLVLEAKVAEEKRIKEQERRAAEKLILEAKMVELEIMKEQRKMAIGFAMPMYPFRDGTNPNESVSGYSSRSTSPKSSEGMPNRVSPNWQATSANTTTFVNMLTTPKAHRANSQPPRIPRQFPSPSIKRDSSQMDSSSDTCVVNKRGRSLSHAEVMEALRNKIQAKSKLAGESSTVLSDNTTERSVQI